MSNIKENAFQIARYLLENPEKNEQVEIKNDLELSEQSFLVAVKFLIDEKYCQIAGQPGTGIIYQKNLAQLQDFVDQISKERIPLSRDAERLLKFLETECTPGMPFFPYTPIINRFKWAESYYTNIAQELHDNKMAEGEFADGNPFAQISLTSVGRQVIRNNFRNPELREKTIHIDKLVTTLSGNNNIVNIGSILTSVNQVVQANSHIEQSAKQELEILLLKLEQELRGIPEENRDDAEAVAEMAKDLIEKATKEKPNKPLVQISAEGLKKAADNIAVITPKVLVAAQAIITFVMQLQK